ncbi:hypothetical protein ACYJ1Y_12760 [Natrialbaceae archaeon A-gly3]
MPSTERSRRQLLAGVGGCLSIVIAGCTGRDSGTSIEMNESDRPSRYSEEHEAMTVRSGDDSQFVYWDGEEPDEDDDDTPIPGRGRLFVLEEADVSDLRIDEDNEAVQAFLDDTDFETESVIVDNRLIKDCYERYVLGVRTESDRVRVQYCQTLKEPTTPCDADREIMEAIFIRIGRAYDDAPSGWGSSESMTCPGETERPQIQDEVNVTSGGTGTTQRGGR